MTTPLNIALIGFGAIGSAAAALLQHTPQVRLAAVVLADLSPASWMPETLEQLAQWAPEAELLDHVPTTGIDLVVEAAGHAAIHQHILSALQRGQPCIVASMGALSETGLAEELEEAARQGQTQVEFVAGAIGAVDALAAAKIGGLSSVRYTGRKPPLAWLGTPAERSVDLQSLEEAHTLFEGSAREAAAEFPKNANVAATISLAGLGMDATQVRLIADPSVTDNFHTVEAVGAFGSFELTMRNLPLKANPKTSAQTVYSLVRAIRNRVVHTVI